MAQETIEVSRLAEQIWWMITGGNPSSFPKKREVELATREAAAYWGKREMYEKYKLEGQWITNGGYIMPFYGLELEAYEGDSFSKKIMLPVKPMDLPKDRGVHMVTYNQGRTGQLTEQKMGKLTLQQRLSPSGLGRTQANPAEYFFTWVDDFLIINGRCNTDRVVITKANPYLVVVDSTNLDDALKYLVISKVTEQFRGYAVKDDIADQNPRTLPTR